MLNAASSPGASPWPIVPMLLLLSACAVAPKHEPSTNSAVSPRRLAGDMPAALPPPAAITSTPTRSDVGSGMGGLPTHSDVGARIGAPPSPREAMGGLASPAPLEPVPLMPPFAAAPLLAPLPDGEVGAGIRAGQCWAQLVVEPRTTRRVVDVVTEDGATRLVVQPPRLRTEQRELVVKEAAQTYRVEPPRFRQVVERVLVKEEVRKLVVVPAVYETREEQVQVESARVVLESCRASAQRAAGAQVTSPQAKCAREIPPRFQTVPRRVLVKAESTREEVVPAQYAEVRKWVLETPARAVPQSLPATTQAVTVTEVAQAAEVREQAVAPSTRPVAVAQHEGMPQLVWRRAVCESEAQPGLIHSMQLALRARGLEVGAADGKLGKQTMSALMAFQRREGLAMGLLTHETLGRLGLVVQPN